MKTNSPTTKSKFVMTPTKIKIPLPEDIRIPHDLDGEMAVIGGMVEGALKDYIPEARLDMFYDIRNRALLKAIHSLAASSSVMNIGAVLREISNVSDLKINWALYINECLDKAAVRSQWGYYCEILCEKRKERQWQKLAARINLGIAEGLSSKQLQESFAPEVMAAIADDEVGKRKSKAEVVDGCIQEIEDLRNGVRGPEGLRLGFRQLDLTIQLRPGEMFVLGARPSVGKTAFALQVISNLVLGQGIPCGLFSLEMPFADIVRRAFAERANISLSNIKSGNIGANEMANLRNVAEQLKAGPLYVEDRPISLLKIQNKTRLWVEQKGVRCLMIDYLQLVPTEGRFKDLREKVTEVSTTVKRMAMQLGVPVIALAQLSRRADEKEDLDMGDLKESGAIEQDADYVVLMKRTKTDDQEFAKKEVRVFIAKSRNGATGEFCFTFDGRFQRFVDRGASTF